MILKRKILLVFILVVLICVVFAEFSLTDEVKPISTGADSQRAQDFQKMVEKHFTAGDRLLMPLGVFAVTNYIRKTDEMKRLVRDGITFIQRYDGNLTIARACEDRDNAAKAGVPLALSFSLSHLKYDPRWWTNYLQALVDQKQIIIWYLPEEPGSENLPELRRLTELLHKLDKSQRPVMTYLKSTSPLVLTEASKFMDCLVYGAYPGESGLLGIPRVRVAYRINLAYRCEAAAVIAALESFKTKSGWTKPEHIEFDAYLALIHGARGIMWYSYAQIRNNPKLLDAVLEVSRLLNGPEYLGEVFIQGQDNQNIQARIIAGPTVFSDGFTKGMKLRMWNNPSVHWRAYNHRGNVYLVMVNCCQVLKQAPSQAEEKALTIEVEFQGFNADSKVALLDGESRYNWDSGKLKVKLKPLGAAVFKFSPVDK